MNRRFFILVSAVALLAAVLPSAAMAAKPADPGSKDGRPVAVDAQVLAGGQVRGKLVPPAPDDVYIVRLVEAPAVAYEGGMAGLPATKPNHGKKLNPNAAPVRTYVEFLTGRHDAILAAVGAAGAKIYSYTYSLNGFAAILTRGQATKVAAMPGVASVEADRLHKTTTEHSPTFLGLTDPSGGLWADLGLDGEGVIVGVIDTGVWPEHPSFSDQTDLADRPGSSGKRSLAYGPPPADWHGTCQAGERWSQDDCNNKLIGARYFLAGFGKHGIITKDYKSARDADGHGSHTTSTAAGNGGVPASLFGVSRGVLSGMAPRARVAVYKTCWNGDAGGCFTTDLSAAIDAAVADGVDVINFSIGSDTPGYLSADAIAFLFAADAGVFLSVSAGNAGPGAGTVGSPAAAPWVTAAGASTQDRTFEGTVVLGDSSSYTGGSVTPGTGAALLPIVDSASSGLAGVPASAAELCFPGALDPAKVAGKIVLCRRGTIARVDKSRAVLIAGGAGMVLYNVNDLQSINTDNHYVPSVHINNTKGLAVKAYVTSAGPTAKIVAGAAVPAQGSVMADFSSRGPNGASADILKPDVTAPGVNILAGNTPTPLLGAPGQLFQSIGGTSMSAPHVAGIAALLKEAHPDWSGEQIRSALVMTARQDVVKEDGSTPADPFDFGGGHIAPNPSVDPGLTVEAGFLGYLGFLCGNGDISALFCLSLSIDPNDLNLPSIAIGGLAGTETVSRTFTAVDNASWTPSVDGLSGVTVTLPAAISAVAGNDYAWDVTFTRTSAPLDAWAFGGIVWTDGAGREVRMPVALRPVALSAPGAVIASASNASVIFNWQVTTGYAGSLSASGFGLAPDQLTADESVAQDPDQDITTGTFTDGVTLYDFIVAPGTRYWAGGIMEAVVDVGDLDIYLFRDSTLNGFALDDLVAFAADGDSDEIVQLIDPPSGAYRLVVHGWGTPGGGGATYDLHRWTVGPAATADSDTLEAHAGAADPAAVSVGDAVTVTATASGLTAAGQYRGLVAYSDGSSELGTTVVIVERDSIGIAAAAHGQGAGGKGAGGKSAGGTGAGGKSAGGTGAANGKAVGRPDEPSANGNAVGRGNRGSALRAI